MYNYRYDNNGDIRKNKSSSFFQNIGYNAIPSNNQGEQQVGYYNPYDIHYLNKKQPSQITSFRTTSQIPQQQQPSIQQQQDKMPKINIFYNKTQHPPIQQPVQYLQHSYDPYEMKRLADLEEQNRILRLKLSHDFSRPSRDIIQILSEKYIQQPPFQPQIYHQPQQQQQPVIIIDEEDNNHHHCDRRRTPPRDYVHYRDMPPQVIYQKQEPQIIREYIQKPQEEVQQVPIEEPKKKEKKEKQKKKVKEGDQVLIIKYAITNDDQFFTYENGNPIQGQQQKQGYPNGNKSLGVNQDINFNINYKELIFGGFFSEKEGKQQNIGWFLQYLFRPAENGDSLVLNTGQYKQTLYIPPLQKPPFSDPRALGNIVLEYVICEKDQNIKNLKQFDLTEIPQEDDNKMLVIELLKLDQLRKLIRAIKYQVEIVDPDEPINDRSNGQCYGQGTINGKTSGNQILLNEKVNLNVGENYLRNVIDPLNRGNHIISINLFDSSNNSIGFIDIPLFKSSVAINEGNFKFPLEDSQIGGALELKIYQIEGAKRYDHNKGLLIKLFNLQNYRETQKLAVHTEIIYDSNITIDSDGNPAKYESEDICEYDQKLKKVDFGDGIEMPVNWKILRDYYKKNQAFLNKIGILIKIIYANDPAKSSQEEKICAWGFHPFFNQQNLNKGQFQNLKLYLPPVVSKFPMDIKNLKPSKYNIDYLIGTCRLDESQRSEIISSQDSISEDENINLSFFYIDIIELFDSDNELKSVKLFPSVKFINRTVIVDDDKKQPIDLQNQNVKVKKEGIKYTFNSSFKVELDIDNYIDSKNFTPETYIVCEFKSDPKKVVAWTYIQALEDEILNTGMFTKQIYVGQTDLQKLRNPQDLVKSKKGSVRFTVQYKIQ